METLPIPRGLAAAAIDDQILRLLGNLWIEVVHQHSQRGFLLPTFARKGGPTRRPNRLIARGLFRRQLRHKNSSRASYLTSACVCSAALRASRPYARVAEMANEYPALTKCFLEAVDRFANPRAQMYRSPAGWQSISA